MVKGKGKNDDNRKRTRSKNDDDEQEEIDMFAYRDMIAKIFPSARAKDISKAGRALKEKYAEEDDECDDDECDDEDEDDEEDYDEDEDEDYDEDYDEDDEYDDAPMPIVGIEIVFVIFLAKLSTTHSITIAKAPDLEREMASCKIFFLSFSFFPFILNLLDVCGSNPMCPITGILFFVRYLTVLDIFFPPSSFTASFSGIRKD